MIPGLILGLFAVLDVLLIIASGVYFGRAHALKSRNVRLKAQLQQLDDELFRVNAELRLLKSFRPSRGTFNGGRL